jgi:hypothetical protein
MEKKPFSDDDEPAAPIAKEEKEQEGHASVSSARQRTLKFMRRMLLAGAAVQAGACGETVVCDPLPPPYDAKLDHKRDAGGDVWKDGPVVCDPLPAPVVCDNDPNTSYFQAFIAWSAQWTQGATALVISVDLRISDYGMPQDLRFTGAPFLSGATLVDQSLSDTRLTFTCSPSAGVTVASARVPLDCRGIGENLLLQLDLSGRKAVGQSIPLTPLE